MPWEVILQQNKPLGLIFLFSGLGLAGQYLFKTGMATEVALELSKLLASDCSQVLAGHLAFAGWAVWHTVLMVLQPGVFLGLVCYAMSTVCWLAILSKTDLSFAYPMISLGYVGILLMDWLVFGEQVTLSRWLGVALISVGILGIYSEKRLVAWGYQLSALILLIALLLGLSCEVVAPAKFFEKPNMLIAMCIPLGLIGQVLFKKGMGQTVNQRRIGDITSGVKALGSAPSLSWWRALYQAIYHSVAMFFSPWVLAGLVSYCLSTVIWLVMLTKVPLSFLYPLLSVGYVVILLIGWLGFNEKVTVVRWYGVLLICCGIVMIYAENLIYGDIWLFGLVMFGLASFLATIKYRQWGGDVSPQAGYDSMERCAGLDR